MDFSTVMQVVTLIGVLCTGVLVPLTLHTQRQARQSREARFDKIDESLSHNDNCLDELRTLVIGSSITRAEFSQYRAEVSESINRHQAEVNETLTRMRAAISQDTNGLNNRITRLEDFHMRKQQDA